MKTVLSERGNSWETKFSVFCAVSRVKVYGPFFFRENTVTGVTYLDELQICLFPDKTLLITISRTLSPEVQNVTDSHYLITFCFRSASCVWKPGSAYLVLGVKSANCVKELSAINVTPRLVSFPKCLYSPLSSNVLYRSFFIGSSQVVSFYTDLIFFKDVDVIFLVGYRFKTFIFK